MSEIVENIENEDDLFKRVPLNETESEHIAAEPYSYWKSVFRVFIRKPSAIISTTLLILMILGIIIIPLFCPEGWTDHLSPVVFNMKNIAPNSEHWWGTDTLGRDLFFLCWQGLGKSMYLAIISSLIVLVIGTFIGLVWGYFKKLDPLFIEIYNLIVNIPSLLIYMLLSSVFISAFPTMPAEVRLIIALTITGWIGLARFIRNQVLIIENREYNIASKTLGTPPLRIMFKNFLPFLLAIIITEFSLEIPGMISSEVSMSYFGVGLPSGTVSIGAVLDRGRAQFMTYPWQLLAPSGILALVIFIFYLLGLAFSDALDPKKHR